MSACRGSAGRLFHSFGPAASKHLLHSCCMFASQRTSLMCPTTKCCAAPACLTMLHLSYANGDWVSSFTLPDFHILLLQIRSSESAPRRGIVSCHHRSGDVPLVDPPRPGSIRSVATSYRGVTANEALQLADDSKERNVLTM